MEVLALLEDKINIYKIIYIFIMKILLNNETKTKLIGLLTILIIFWLVLYFIPEIFVSLFNTILGNIILILIMILVSLNDYRYGIILGLIFLIIFRFKELSKEGFTWSPQSTKDFLLIQNSNNPRIIFDVNMIQKNQASQEEVDYFNKNGMWPWSQEVISLYKQSVMNNPYIRTLPEDAVNYARLRYNQAAILRLLSYQTKEGQFLLNGVLVRDPSGNKLEDLPSGFGKFGYHSGLIGHLNDDVIKCTSSDADSKLEKITYTGKGGIFNQQTKKITEVDFNDLENLIPGFTFVNGPCNPCGAINEKPDYSCPFKLNVKNKPAFISSVWQYLWDVKDDPLVSQPSFLSENINPNEFPLLSELQTELNKQKKNF
jgi:hypothetical protein